jgi:hypothetical protein
VIGDEPLARVEEFRAWLANNEYKSEIMTYLSRD